LEAIEEWRDIPGHPNYQASSKGRIRNKVKGNILIPKRSPANSGIYWKVDLGKRSKDKAENKRRRNRYIHHLVALAFHGHKGQNVDHEDTDRSNNAPHNLTPMTAKENQAKKQNNLGRGEAWESEDGNADFNTENF
jgi:hypothetical protein